MNQARSRNQAIDGLAYGAASFPESPEIQSGCNRHFLAARGYQLKLPKGLPGLGECPRAANTLKDLAENEVGQTKTLPSEFAIKPLCLGIPKTTKVVDPHGGINDHHCQSVS